MNVTLIATLIYPGVPTLAAVLSIVLHRNQCRKLREKLEAKLDGFGEKVGGKLDDTFAGLNAEVDGVRAAFQAGLTAFQDQQKADMLRIMEVFSEYTERPDIQT